MCTTNEGEDPRVKMGEVLDNLSNCNSGSGSGSSILRTRCIPVDSGDGSSTCQENPTSATFDPSFANADSSKMRAGLEGKVRFPSELISSCVSTFLMIQVNLIFHVLFRVIVAFIFEFSVHRTSFAK